jgi:4-hydroxy-3-methylbut-2-enyl diphosphate reductase
MKKIILATPRGFCAGVERAIEIVEQALKIYGSPVYVKNEIVHNIFVVEQLKAKGAIFVNSIQEIPKNNVTIFSAHGVSEQVEIEANEKDLLVIDATCPLVKKVHSEASRNEKEGKHVILIGHPGHPEVEGTAGRLKGEVIIVSSIEDIAKINLSPNENLAYVTQTTLSVDDTIGIIKALKEKFPFITGPDVNDICYATQNRQNAVKKLAQEVEVVLVIGSKKSSNSNRLKDIAEEMGVKSFLIDSEADIDIKKIGQYNLIGITAGASAPEILVENVINFLKEHFDCQLQVIAGPKEEVHFKLPAQLRTLSN